MTPEPLTLAEEQRRARILFLQRLAELIHPDADIGRRARTLNLRLAIDETVSLAASHVRSRGHTRNTADPYIAGHGVAMLPQVAEEALDLLSDDFVLKRSHSQIAKPLRSLLRLFAAPEPNVSSGDVAQLDAFSAHLSHTYCGDAFDVIRAILTNTPKDLVVLESVTQSLASDLRGHGWTDLGLLEHIEKLGSCADFDAAFAAFRAALTAKPIRFTCYVAVRVQGVEGQFPNDDDLCIVPKVPPAAGFPTQGPYIQTFVDAIDPRVAADNALARVSAVLGAVAIFVTQDVLVRSRIVLVQGPNGNSMVFDTSSPLVRERRLPRSGQVVRIARSTLAATKRLRLQDAAFEAMRHLKRASEAGDAESRFMLLWLGIERLVMGGDHRTILDAVRTIVPPAITIGKIRRDVESLARAVARISYTGEEKMKLQRIAGGTPPRNPVIDQQKLLHFLLTANDDESFQLTSLFYAHDVRLTQWYFRLRKRLAHGDADAIASYLDESRLRVERQILRLYRARNSVAHAARGPEWLGELIRHASYYLTNLIAIVLSYREHDAIRPAIEILVARVGQYDAYIELLKHGSPRACTPRALLRPTSIVGTRKN